MKKLILFVMAGAILLLFPMLQMARWKQIKLHKTILVALTGTVSGVTGAFLWYWLENGKFGGISYFGAVFLVPIAFALVFWLFQEPYGTILDLCAPAECAMLVMMKIHCAISKCCGGRELFVTGSGVSVHFPSQLAEMTNAVVLLSVIMIMSRKKICQNALYPCFLVLYGISRFILNLFRANTSDFFLGMPAGNVWSLLSVLAGGIWLFIAWRKNRDLFCKKVNL